jgi:hypothetical protein
VSIAWGELPAAAPVCTTASVRDAEDDAINNARTAIDWIRRFIGRNPAPGRNPHRAVNLYPRMALDETDQGRSALRVATA